MNRLDVPRAGRVAVWLALSLEAVLDDASRETNGRLPEPWSKVRAALRSVHSEVNRGQLGTRVDGFADASDAPNVQLVLTYAEAGALLGRSAGTVKRLIASGDLPTVVVGSQRMVRRSDLLAYIDGLPTATPVRSLTSTKAG